MQLFKFFFFTITVKSFPAGIYLFKIGNENTGKMCDICTKLTRKIPEGRH